MIYKSYEDMADCIRRNLWKVPHDVDLIVGIPRSGMIPALMIAEFMNKRCVDIDSFIEGKTGYIGNRGNMIRESGTDKVLVVDDSVAAGTAMRKAKEQLASFKDKYTLLFCCIYAENPESVSIVDICLENIYNPNDKKYYEQFKINCATCATAYALRLRGFDVKAKGNEKGSGSLNEKIANANEYLNVWKNLDGTKAEAIHTDDWMKKNGIKEMTTNDYRNYFDETCKEKGVYVVMVRYSDDSSGHATILQRDSDDVLYYIEPQRYEMSKGADGKRSLDDLLMRHDGSQKLSSKPSHGYGVLRVDDKLFNTDYADLFEI